MRRSLNTGRSCSGGSSLTRRQARGGDGWADWVLVLVGYERAALEAAAAQAVGDAALQAMGAMPGTRQGLYSLSHSALPAEWAEGAAIIRPGTASGRRG